MLYTRRGDDGTTGKYGSCRRISKASALSEALGACDELNSFLGVCRVQAQKTRLVADDISVEKVLLFCQELLFIVQSELAGAPKKVKMRHVEMIERVIDICEKEVPPLKNFVIAGGTEFSALLDFARALARRTERRVVFACETGEVTVADGTRAYLNRLSSLLFALARLVNAKSGIKEESPRYQV